MNLVGAWVSRKPPFDESEETMYLVPKLIWGLVAGCLIAAATTSVEAQEKSAGTVLGGGGGGITLCSGDATNLLYPLDATYMLVDFFGDGPSGSGPAQGPDQHNDDDSAFLALPFTFDLYGDLYSSCFINNNGNITFGQLFSSFIPVGFPDPLIPPMIAPFWGDVDTGNPTNPVGDVFFRFFDSDGDIDVDTLVVTWDNVGYFNENNDLLNTFQVVISDGSNPLLGVGNNVAFCFDDMCWTTGQASGGIGGFGGTPATVGANRGNGSEFFQVGLFDQTGDAYDGPLGMNDGVDFLDGQCIFFNTSTTTTNLDPIISGLPASGSVTLGATTDLLDLDVQFLSPEAGQTTTVVVQDLDNAQAAGLQIVNTPGNTALVSLEWAPDCGDVGTYELVFVATDDFVPAGQSTATLELVVEPCGDIQITEIRAAQPSTDEDEYFEISGPAGLSLDGLTYLVIGDGAPPLGSGVIEEAIDLTGFSIPADGVFFAAEDSDTFGVAADILVNLSFENNDNVTHLLVGGFTGFEGDDLDADDDGMLDAAPWNLELDCVAIVGNLATGDLIYCSTTVGPEGPFVPGHVVRCPSGDWGIGPFSPSTGIDTPGSTNVCEDCNENMIEDPVELNTVPGIDSQPNGVIDECELGRDFIRSDANANGEVTIADAVRVLQNVFFGVSLICEKSADANDDGSLDVADGVMILNVLFNGINPLDPFPACGQDQTLDALTCDDFPICP